MANEMMRTIAGGVATPIGLTLPDDLTELKWRRIGEQLSVAERAVGWWIGDWWNAYKPQWGDRAKLFTDSWTGPAYQTCRNCGNASSAFDIARRRANLPFSHHFEVVTLERDEADRLLTHAEAVRAETGKPLPVRMLRQEVKRLRRSEREVELAGKIEQAAATLNGGELYGVILADPPWKFEPYSTETGMDRAAENHYPTMTLEQLSEMKPPAADDCALFLWATTPMLLDALDLLAAWDFSYKTHWIWLKPHPGTGYWNRSCHELLLLGVRGRVPAPAPGDQYDSVFTGELAAHSVKPAAAAEMIEEMFPSAKLLEMFARGPRLGWTVWGAESAGEQIAPDSGLFESEDAPASADRAA